MNEMDNFKTVIITGANRGLGYQCAKEIALNREWQVVIGCRELASANEAAKQLMAETGNQNIAVLALDLANLASVKNFVTEFTTQGWPPLKAIVCNAGVQIIKKITYTVDGFESTFAINHLGHFLLVNLLLPDLKPPARIVFVSSGTHDPKQWTGMPIPHYIKAEMLAYPERDANFKMVNVMKFGQRAYTNSKLCNLLCAYEMDRRLKAMGLPITVNGFDPGLMPGSGLARDYNRLINFVWRNFLPILTRFAPNVNTMERSGKALARLILDATLGEVSGRYFEGFKDVASSPDSYDKEKALDLWQTSIRLTKLVDEQSFFCK